jgi:peptide/nickel transport system substrate-binding protein
VLAAPVLFAATLDTVTLRISQDPDTLNPLLSGMAVAREVMQPVLSGLVGVDDKLGFRPELAVTVPTLENGLVVRRGKDLAVTYKLRKGVKWHDGRPFSSRDVAFTWRFALNPRARVIDRTGYDRISAVETPAPDVARVVFKGVYAPYLRLFDMVLPAHLLGTERDPNSAPFNRKPIGTGPYRVGEFRPGDRLVLEANRSHHGGKPRVPRLVMLVLPDDNTAFVRFKSGDLDVYQSVAQSQVPLVAKLPAVRVVKTPDLLYEHLALNTSREPFDDLRVRQAVALAIDKSALSRAAYAGLNRPAWCDHPPLSWAHDPALRGRFDPAKAARLLDEAGWQTSTGGVRTRGGKRLAFRLITTSGKKPRELAATLIRSDLGKVGFEVSIETIPGAVLFSPQGPLKTNDFHAAMWAWDTGLDPDPTNFWHSAHFPPRGSNVTRFKHPEADRLLAAGAGTVDRARRTAAYRKLSQLLFDQAPDIPLVYWNRVSAIRTRLQGWRPGPAGNLWNTADWSIKSM